MDAGPFFFSPPFLLRPYKFLEKTSECSLEDELYSSEPREAERQIVHLTSCPSRSLSHLFPYRRLLFLLQHFCTFPLLPIHVVCSLSMSLSHC